MYIIVSEIQLRNKHFSVSIYGFIILISQYFEHISKTVVPGSVRIACTKYTDNVEATAWKRPDGSIGVVLINRSEAVMPLCIRLNDEEADLMLFPKAIARLIIR